MKKEDIEVGKLYKYKNDEFDINLRITSIEKYDRDNYILVYVILFPSNLYSKLNRKMLLETKYITKILTLLLPDE